MGAVDGVMAERGRFREMEMLLIGVVTGVQGVWALPTEREDKCDVNVVLRDVFMEPLRLLLPR